MKQSVKSSRDRFRRLAVLEISPAAILGMEGGSGNIEYLLQAVRAADAIFWRQVSPDIDYQLLLQQAGSDNELREMLLFNHGPYDRLSNDAPLLPGLTRSPGAGFYPPNLSRRNFVDYIQNHPESRNDLESPYTVIRRINGRLTAIPFHKAYRDLVDNLSDLLMKAAALEVHPAFKEFLIQRSRDLRTDEFSASDALWVNLTDNPIDLVVGPHDVYQDELMGLKAAYEGILVKRNLEETARVQHFQDELPKMCASLEGELGRSLPVFGDRVRIRVAELAYAGGDAYNAIPAIAFNLPNDERIVEEVGARQIILRNVLEAKFRLVGWQILDRILRTPPREKGIAFQSFLTFTALHEMAHSIGPHRIVKNGERTTVNRCLKQHFSVFEEMKADTLGACLTLKATREAGVQRFMKTYVGELLRAVRFGFKGAHGGSSTIQFNYLLRAGAIAVDAASGKVTINHAKFGSALCKLAGDVLHIQECGDFAAAHGLIAKFRVMSSQLKELTRRTADLPLDLRIRFRSYPAGPGTQSRRLEQVDSKIGER